ISASSVVSEIFFPDPASGFGSGPLLRRIKGSLAENIPLLRDALKNTGRDLLLWTRRGTRLRALLVVSVGTVNASGLDRTVHLHAFLSGSYRQCHCDFSSHVCGSSRGFLALFFAFMTAIYIGALSVAVFVISTATISAIIAVVITTGWIGFFWTVWLATRKSVSLVKHSLTMTGSALSAYSSARHARRYHETDKISD
ncbi:uncharacterized protein LOC130778048, partial [Actinidia eriantha]|uniref:uncharacterized protein LOC130778048 n=1 Tax=Actinidia eriantha TaxID=165200 RepID=UPI00258DCB90